jgi:hypothetical protein
MRAAESDRVVVLTGMGINTRLGDDLAGYYDNLLLRRGHEGSVMEFPAVPLNEARVRLFVTSEHEVDYIDGCADNIIEAGARSCRAHERRSFRDPAIGTSSTAAERSVGELRHRAFVGSRTAHPRSRR